MAAATASSESQLALQDDPYAFSSEGHSGALPPPRGTKPDPDCLMSAFDSSERKDMTAGPVKLKSTSPACKSEGSAARYDQFGVV